MAVNPTEQQLQEITAIAGSDADAPLVMLNLNRYRERAAYEGDPPGEVSGEVSGREAYQRYAIVAWQVFNRVGAEIVWSTRSTMAFVGDAEERFDDVIAVRYPSASAFLELVSDPELLAATTHRDAGLERALVLRCDDSGEGPLRGL